MSEKNKDDEE